MSHAGKLTGERKLKNNETNHTCDEVWGVHVHTTVALRWYQCFSQKSQACQEGRLGPCLCLCGYINNSDICSIYGYQAPTPVSNTGMRKWFGWYTYDYNVDRYQHAIIEVNHFLYNLLLPFICVRNLHSRKSLKAVAFSSSMYYNSVLTEVENYLPSQCNWLMKWGITALPELIARHLET